MDAAEEEISGVETELALARSQLAAMQETNTQQEIDLDAVADLCGEALGTAREMRSPIGCASALANYVVQLRDENAAMREAGEALANHTEKINKASPTHSASRRGQEKVAALRQAAGG